MKKKYENVINIPEHPADIYCAAREVAYNVSIDQLLPNNFARQQCDMTYEEAMFYICSNEPYYTIMFRNNSIFGADDHFEFACNNMRADEHGKRVFVWIRVSPEKTREIFEKFDLKTKKYEV